ncbi:MAG: tetratricopeptide repeat protein [Planctomycetota bacterium]
MPDPKDQIGIINQAAEIKELASQGKYVEALALAKEVAAQCEGYDYPVHLLAHAYEKLGRMPEACGVLQEYAERYPSADILLHLAKNYSALKEYDRMEEVLQAAEILDPLRGSIPKLRGDRFLAQGRYAEAVAQYKRAIEIDGARLGPEGTEALLEAEARLRGEAP